MSNKKDIFFSTDNFNLLYEMLSLDIKKKFNSDIESNSSCRQILFSNMDSTFNKNRNKNLKELNIITIKQTGPLLYQKIHDNPKNIQVSPRKDNLSGHSASKEIPIRDISLGKQLPEYTNMRPEFHQKEISITDTYEKMNQERNENYQKKQPDINFSLPLSTQNETDPNEMFQRMTNNRQQEKSIIDREKHNQGFDRQNHALENFENMSQQFKTTESDFLRSNQQQQHTQYEQFSQQQIMDTSLNIQHDSLDNSLSTRNDVSTISEIERRIQQDQDTRNKNNSQDLNPSFIYKPDEKLEQQYQELISKPVKKIEYEHQESNLKSKSREKKNYIEIESIDRLLENPNHSRYSFKVSFSPAFKQIKRLAMFKNNPTILATQEQSNQGKRGEPNQNGWNDRNGEFYPPYDSSKPFGNIITYEDITFSGTNNLYVENNFRNITEIKILNLIIPYEYVLHYGDLNPSSERDMVALREPYLLVNIQEINGVYNSTSENITNSFCKLIRNDDWNSDPRGNSDKSQYHGNIQFIPSIDNVSKTYYPAPLASLNSFTIQILRPNGELISTSKDYSNIKYIKYGSPPHFQGQPNSHLVIKLDTYVDSTIFKSYSDIIIKDYSLPVDTQLCPEKSDFEAFINRTSGHTIINTGNDKPGENYGHINLIYITSQGSFNDKTGTYEINEYGNADNLTNLSSNLNDTSEIYNEQDLQEKNPFGTVFNTSYQSHISFQITTLENDAEELKVRLI